MTLPLPPLSVGEAAALINVGLFLLRVTLPLLQGAVLLGTLEHEKTAATWTVLPKIVYSSYLPQILRTDSAAGFSDGVSLRVSVMVYVSLFTTIILGTAQVLSPIGLGEVALSGHTVNATFAYVPDPSVLGMATLGRESYALSRGCGKGAYKPCPGIVSTAGPEEQQDSQVVFTTTVPTNITECFGSGTSSPGDLRSSSFDIHFRQFSAQLMVSNTNQTYKNVTGCYNAFIGQVVTEPGYHLREGLVIDAIDGGLGFRNHTVPSSPEMVNGATWEEDLLWMEPLTDRNAWFEYEDHASLYNQTLPYPDGEYHFDQRLLNATTVFKSKIQEAGYGANGSQTRIYRPNGPQTRIYGANGSQTLIFGPDQLFGDLIQIIDQVPMVSFTFTELDSLDGAGCREAVDGCSDTALYEEPFRWPRVSLRKCRNYVGSTAASADIPLVSCFYSVPPPVQVRLRNTTVEMKIVPRPISICAIGITATVKRVRFSYNATERNAAPSLSRLKVLSVGPVPYSRDEDKPLWAVENPGPGYNLTDINLQWGLVNDTSASRFAKGIRTIRAESLPLPATLESYNLDGSGYGDSLAGSRVPGLSLRTLLDQYSYQYPTDLESALRWQNLSDTPEKIINLRRTDLAANMMAGSKSRLDATPNGQGEVLMYQQRVTYRYEYGIAAYICCGIWLAWATACLYMLCIPRLRARLSPASLRVAVNSMSVGRLLVWAEDAGVRDSDLLLKIKMPTSDWLKAEGRRVVDLPVAAQEIEEEGIDTEVSQMAPSVDGAITAKVTE
ncbi:hypothetical protein QBC47DRAFT_398655 [Echria macrotheca]|uniref:Uncharacterized protein n=1 Tax=Echria macrotheca TaxID=438768 RepID=A0AAJ0FA86_9PEZI|nr:hypothetical protein QBC47DRAFT_398655 [Echria macrotheca]